MRFYFTNSSSEIDEKIVEVYKEKDSWILSSKGNKKEVYFREVAGKKFFSFDQKKWNKLFNMSKVEKLYQSNNEIRVYKGFKPSGQSELDAGSLVSQMPGKVVKLLIDSGEKVEKGQTLLILEAMKMENEIKAGIDGVISQISVSEGESIESGTVMVEIKDSN